MCYFYNYRLCTSIDSKMKYFLILVIGLSLFACSEDPKSGDSTTKNNPTAPPVINNIETLFDKDVFDDPKKEMLLKELKICSDKNKGPEDYMNPACSPRFFELIPFAENIPLENAFILQVKSKVNGFPLRRLLIFVRERDQLVKVNGFVGNLIGTKKSSSKYYDLILRFNDKDQGEDIFYNCTFAWDGTTYKYKSVEQIYGPGFGGDVKAELKDSISKEVYKDIMDNKMIF